MGSRQQLDAESTIARMRDVLSRQRAAFFADGPPSEAVRLDRIDRVIAVLLDNREERLASPPGKQTSGR